MAKRPTPARSEAREVGTAPTRQPAASRRPIDPTEPDIQREPPAEGEPSMPEPPSQRPEEEEIRIRAYHRYLERGGGHGMDFDDWLEAERELKRGT
jgi:hypothetical protein